MEATVDINKFVEIEFIDEGSYGKVYKIADIETRQELAAKILKEPINSISDDDLIFLSREVNLNSGMDHPSVSKHIGFSPIGFNQSPNPVIIMKYYKNGPLKKFIKNKNQYKGLWNDTQKLILIYGIASGMMYLHAHNIIHRDLKLDNILLDDKLFPIICDFGYAKRIDSNGNFISIIESTKYAKGTPVYLAPEVFITNESSKESDVYAFGILLYEMLTETTPYEGFDLIHLLMAVQNGQRPPFTKPIDDSYKDLIERCWSQDPKDRPSFEEIVELLKNDKFITPNVNKKTFRSYVEYIESYNSSFTLNSIIKPENCIQFAQKQFHEYDLRSFNDRKTTFSTFLSKIGLFDENICPENVLEQLDTKCRELVLDVKNDAEKQYLVGTYFIEQKCGFPLNIPLGVEYLERSISKGNTNSVVYLSKMLIDGVLINRDYEKTSTYLSKHYGKDDRIFYLYGKVFKKKGNFKESFKKFKEGSEKNIIECYYEYGKHLFWGKGCTIDIKKAFHYFNLSRTEGVKKSDFYIKVFDKLKEYEYFNQLSINDKYFFIKKVIEHNLKEHKKDDEIMLGNEIKIYSYEIYDCLINCSFQEIYFILMLKLFDSISIEILYPMKSFELALAHLADIKKDLIFDMNILVYLSKNQIPSDLDPFHVIDNIEIMPPVQKIQKYAFGKFSSLTQIKIPSSVKSIGEYAFCGCEKLTNIEILSSLTSIEKHTFDKCFSLIQIRIPSSVTLIGEYAFSECKSLEEIIIPSSVKSIGEYAFYGCEKLTNIEILSSLTSIEKHTFDKCFSLIQIRIPSSVTLIGEYAFSECKSLEEIIIPSSVKSIGKKCFYNCSSLTNISFDSPCTLMSIQESTFELCSSLTKINIPPSITSIGHFAFKNCSKLKEFNINHTISRIELNAFDDCPSIESIPTSIVLKVVIIGGCSVGKTTILHRYVKNKFYCEVQETVGIEFERKFVNIDGYKVKLHLFDLAGHESFYKISRFHSKGAHCAVVVTDFVEQSYAADSFKYYKNLLNDVGPIPAVLLRNKCDFEIEHPHLVEQFNNFQKEYNLKSFDVSAKDNTNIDEAFQYVATEAFHKFLDENKDINSFLYPSNK